MRTGCFCFFGMVRVTAAAEALCFYTPLPLRSLACLRRLPDGRERRVDRLDSLNNEALSANFEQRIRLSSLENVDPKCFAPAEIPKLSNSLSPWKSPPPLVRTPPHLRVACSCGRGGGRVCLRAQYLVRSARRADE